MTAYPCSKSVAESAFAILSQLSPLERPLFRPYPSEADLRTELQRRLARGSRSSAYLGNEDHFESILRLAYAEVVKGTMTSTVLATLVLRWQLQSDFRDIAHGAPRLLPILGSDGKLTPFAKTLLLPIKTMDPNSSGLSDEKLSQIEVWLQNVPVTETEVLAIPLPTPLIDTRIFPTTFSMMRTVTLVNTTHLLAREDTTSLGFPESEMVVFAPPLTLLQAYLDARYGKVDAIQLAPRFGLCTDEEMLRLGRAGKRPFGLGFPRLGSPETADDISTNRSGFSWHDFFHADLGSRIPNYYRQFLLHFLERFERTIRQSELSGTAIPVGPNFQISPALIRNRKFNARGLRLDAIDLSPTSTTLNIGSWEVPMSFAERIVEDYGSIRDGYSALVVMDLVRDPAWYRERRIDPQAVLQDLGTEALQLAKTLGSR